MYLQSSSSEEEGQIPSNSKQMKPTVSVLPKRKYVKKDSLVKAIVSSSASEEDEEAYSGGKASKKTKTEASENLNKRKRTKKDSLKK